VGDIVSIDLWLWLERAPSGLILVVAFAVLFRNRRRSRRATGLALVALYVLGSMWLLWTGLWVSFGLWGDAWRDAVLKNQSVIMGATLLTEILRAGCILLVVFAVVTDRQRVAITGPEADYVDDRDPGANVATNPISFISGPFVSGFPIIAKPLQGV
jgi:hypothetical protein